MNPTTQQILQLRDIHLPDNPGMWPPAPGWWVLAALILVLLIWAGLIAFRHYRLHQQRKRILSMIDEMEWQSGSNINPEWISKISILLRRLALMHYPRKQVAALTGSSWLNFLDLSGGQGQFTNGPGRILADGPYQPAIPADLDTRALATVVRKWVKNNTER